MSTDFWMTDLEDSDFCSVTQVGGKGLHLLKLKNWGLSVPRFLIVTTEAHKYWLKHQQLPKPLIQEIANQTSKWHSPFFAVRSSMSQEDGERKSFAGIFDTFLYVRPDQIIQKIEECFRSVSSDRANAYLAKQGLKNEDIKCAVVVQAMVHSRVSGVAFSRNPNGHSGLVLVESAWGLGEGLVSGQVEVDSFWLDRFGQTWKKQVSQKYHQAQYLTESQQVEIVSVDERQRSCSSLENTEILKIFESLLKCEKKLGGPADMEWAMDQAGQLQVLQVRSITQSFQPIQYFADTNLAESYPQKVSPFTAHFIPRIYEKVIGETLALMGAKWDPATTGMSKALRSLIFEVSGHLYYNLNSYYTVLHAYPGGRKNIDGWHRMIGGQELPISYEIVDVFRGWRRIVPSVSFFYYLLRHDRIYKKFISAKLQELDRKKSEIEECQQSRATAQLPDKYFHDVVGWGLTSLNDIFVVMSLKILDWLIQKNGLPPTVITQWIKTEEGVDSVQALTQIKKIAPQILGFSVEEQAEVLCLFEIYTQQEVKAARNLWPDLLLAFREKGWHQRVNLIEDYLKEFGERCFEELKIESLPFSESPAEFLKVLRGFAPVKGERLNGGQSQSQKLSARQAVRLSFVDSWILRITLYYSQKAIQARESTRLMRGRFYGLMRGAVLKTATLFIQENLERCVQAQIGRSDFFALTMEELKNYAIGKLSSDELIALIKKNSNREARKSELQYPEFYAASCEDQEPYFVSEVEGPGEDIDRVIQGMGVSQGLIKGQVLIVRDPREALNDINLAEKILVTRSTDPAWIFIMSQCRGLISEKGSLLSHTAIVGRELEIPTIVAVKEATVRLKNGQMIQMNGQTGKIEIFPDE